MGSPDEQSTCRACRKNYRAPDGTQNRSRNNGYGHIRRSYPTIPIRVSDNYRAVRFIPDITRFGPSKTPSAPPKHSILQVFPDLGISARIAEHRIVHLVYPGCVNRDGTIPYFSCIVWDSGLSLG